MITFMIWYEFISDMGETNEGLLLALFLSSLLSLFTICADIFLFPIEIIALIVFVIIKIFQRIKGE